MRNSPMKLHLRTAGFLAVLALAPISACTDLTEVPSSSISPENFYANEAEVLGGLVLIGLGTKILIEHLVFGA